MNELIKVIVETAYKNKEGHIASSLSVLNILHVLYSSIIYDSIETDRNRLILSKGHASLGLYAVLDKFGKLDIPMTDFCKFDSLLGGHPSDKLSNIEVSTGSLGHGLPTAIGMAMAYKIQKFHKHIYVIVGDGEMNEGSNWESLLLGAHHKLDNITCVLDYNRSNDRGLRLDDIHKKIESFNWHILNVNGHDDNELKRSLTTRISNKPVFIVANTIKGKGINRMENNPEWHHKIPNDVEYKEILKELDNGINI